MNLLKKWLWPEPRKVHPTTAARRVRRLTAERLESRELLTVLPAGFQETLVANGWNPAGEEFAPDGRLFVANKSGSITIVSASGQRIATPFYSVPVDTYSDRGLTSVAFDPNFSTNHYVYIYYTAAVPSNPNVANNGALTRLVRLKQSDANPNVADPASATVILDGIPSPNGIHTGGFLQFGADGMLYLGVGEGDIQANSQDLTNVSGKILRLDVKNYPNIVPADNPFVGKAGDRGEIWAYGFRNPFSGAIVPGTSNVYINDVGGSNFEEIDHLVKGGNYGWPLAEGVNTNPNVTNVIDPIFTYSHNGAGAAITGGAYYTGAQFPSSYKNQYFVNDLVQGVIRVVNPATGQGSVWATGLNLPTDIIMGPDGSLYYTSIGTGSVYKISYVGSADRPPVAAAKANVTSGLAPLTVKFDGSGSSDPDGDPLVYSWDFGDGTTGTGVTVQHAYSANGVYKAVLTVSDRPVGGLTSTAAPIAITVGDSLPVPSITLPVVGTTFRGGDTIQFSGSATDHEDGTLPASAFTWNVLLLDEGNIFPYLGPFRGVSSGNFKFPVTGIDADQSFRVSLTVTDSAGLSQTASVDLNPVLANITLSSNIAGTQFLFDGQPTAAGSPIASVVGINHTIEAPATQLVNGTMYKFVGWSDGGPANHTISTPSTATTYTAQYAAMPLAATYTNTAPTQMSAGQTVSYQVTVKNIGTTTWSATGTNQVQLGVYFDGTSDAVGAWATEPKRFALTQNVAPGQSFTFNVKVTAPTTPGTYVLRDRLVQEHVAWFDTLEKVNVSVGTLVASYSATPPTFWGTSQAQNYSITVTNNGTATWSASGPSRVRLSVLFSGTSSPPALLYNLPNDVAPGQSVTFSVNAVASSNAGSHILTNQMVSDSAGKFAAALNTTVSVQKLSATYSASTPTTWNAGEIKTYSITLINNGTSTWKATGTNAVHLGVYFAGASDAVGAWSQEPARYTLPKDVAPGQSVTLSIKVQAPTTPGTYVLRQRMVMELVNWFNPMQKTNVTVNAVAAAAVKKA